MSRRLVLLRHAKSDWSEPVVDFDRSLNERGESSIAVIAQNLQAKSIVPQIVMSSPAKRAKQTILGVAAIAGYAVDAISWQQDLYHASIDTLLACLAACPEKYQTVLLTGHNPGLEELIYHLAASVTRPSDGKLMTTGACALLAMPDDWSDLPAACAMLEDIIRPKGFGF